MQYVLRKVTSPTSKVCRGLDGLSKSRLPGDTTFFYSDLLEWGRPSPPADS
jgi:hypothetical protein